MSAIFFIIVADLYSRDFGLVFFLFAMVLQYGRQWFICSHETLLSVKILKKKNILNTTGAIEDIHILSLALNSLKTVNNNLPMLSCFVFSIFGSALKL